MSSGSPATIDENHELTDNPVSIKRSQSSSSVDDQSPPHGSPKPVMRRKNKPAPVPPTLPNKTSPTPQRDTSAEKDHPTQLTKTNSFKNNRNSQLLGDHTSPLRTGIPPNIEKEKREGMWVPPSPSQLASRKGTTGPDQTATRPPFMAPPPKPPQPQFDARNRLSNVPVQPNEPPPKPSPLKYKSSFKSSSSMDSPTASSTSSGEQSSPARHNTTDNIDTSSASSTAFANSANQFSSLPRHFTTDNSYKNQRAPRPPSIYSVCPNVPPPQPPVAPVSLPVNTTNTEIKSQPDQGKRGSDAPIGFELLEQEVRKNSTDKSGEESAEELSKPNFETGSNSTSENNNIRSEGIGFIIPNPPVPIPRASLIHGSGGSPPPPNKEGHQAPVARERPSLMAKPRDLPKRTQSQNKGIISSQQTPAAVSATSNHTDGSSGCESDNHDANKPSHSGEEEAGDTCKNGMFQMYTNTSHICYLQSLTYVIM